jgi:hypothetical protein
LAVAVVFACLALGRQADAQQNVVVINGAARTLAAAERPQTVTINFQLTLPAPELTSSQDMTSSMAATTQSLYDIVNHECDVLTATLKGTCRLSKLNIGGNVGGQSVPNYGNRGNVVSANANATFEIDPPAPQAAPAPTQK